MSRNQTTHPVPVNTPVRLPDVPPATIREPDAHPFPDTDGSPQLLEIPTITWDWLHATIATALRHIEPGAPLYVTADVLTDELLPSLKGVHHPATA